MNLEALGMEKRKKAFYKTLWSCHVIEDWLTFVGRLSGPFKLGATVRISRPVCMIRINLGWFSMDLGLYPRNDVLIRESEWIGSNAVKTEIANRALLMRDMCRDVVKAGRAALKSIDVKITPDEGRVP